jgi:hypothetical protein
MADPPQADARELSEFGVSFACDTNELDANKLTEMSANREPSRLVGRRTISKRR